MTSPWLWSQVLSVAWKAPHIPAPLPHHPLPLSPLSKCLPAAPAAFPVPGDTPPGSVCGWLQGIISIWSGVTLSFSGAHLAPPRLSRAALTALPPPCRPCHFCAARHTPASGPSCWLSCCQESRKARPQPHRWVCFTRLFWRLLSFLPARTLLPVVTCSCLVGSLPWSPRSRWLLCRRCGPSSVSSAP